MYICIYRFDFNFVDAGFCIYRSLVMHICVYYIYTVYIYICVYIILYIYRAVDTLHMFWCGSVAPVLQSAPPCAVLDMYSAHGLPLAEPAAAAGLVLPVLFLTLGNQSW